MFSQAQKSHQGDNTTSRCQIRWLWHMSVMFGSKSNGENESHLQLSTRKKRKTTTGTPPCRPLAERWLHAFSGPFLYNLQNPFSTDVCLIFFVCTRHQDGFASLFDSRTLRVLHVKTKTFDTALFSCAVPSV